MKISNRSITIKKEDIKTIIMASSELIDLVDTGAYFITDAERRVADPSIVYEYKVRVFSDHRPARLCGTNGKYKAFPAGYVRLVVPLATTEIVVNAPGGAVSRAARALSSALTHTKVAHTTSRASISDLERRLAALQTPKTKKKAARAPKTLSPVPSMEDLRRRHRALRVGIGLKASPSSLSRYEIGSQGAFDKMMEDVEKSEEERMLARVKPGKGAIRSIGDLNTRKDYEEEFGTSCPYDVVTAFGSALRHLGSSRLSKEARLDACRSGSELAKSCAEKSERAKTGVRAAVRYTRACKACPSITRDKEFVEATRDEVLGDVCEDTTSDEESVSRNPRKYYNPYAGAFRRLALAQK